MISVTGTFKGLSVRDKIVSVNELIEHFGIPFTQTSKIQYALNLKSGKVATKDLATGKMRFSERRNLTPIAQGSYKGESMELRYFKSRTPDPKNINGYRHNPRRIVYTGNVFNVSDLEVAIILYLMPGCKESPFRNPRSGFEWHLYSAETAAQTRLAVEEEYAKVRELVLMAEDDMALRWAKAASHLFQAFSMNETNSPAIAKAALLDVARQKPSIIQDVTERQSSKAIGLVLWAQDKGHIQMSRDASGRYAWFFSKELGGSQIVSVPAGKPTLDVLVTHAQDPDVYAAIGRTITGQEIKLDTDEDVIKAGIDKGVVRLHPTDGKIYIFTNNQFQDRALKIPEDPAKWKDELRASPSKTVISRIKSALND